MVEYIGLLKTASFFVAMLGFLLLCLSVFIVWKYGLLDYYRFKTGKGKKKISDIQKPKAVSQYYSESLDESHSHEIVNQEYGQDSGDLIDNITIGRNATGEVQQVIDNEVVDFSLKTKRPSIPLPEGGEETTLLGQTENSQKLYVPSDFDNEKVFDTYASNVEDFYENDDKIDETDIIPLPEPNFSEIYENDEHIDETDVMQILQHENEGNEETQLLSENLDETDAINIEPSVEVSKEENNSREFNLHIKNKEAFLGRKLTAAEVTLEKLEFSRSTMPVKSKEESSPSDSDETELLQKEDRRSGQVDSDGSEETELLNKAIKNDGVTEDLSKEQRTSVQDNEATTLLVDKGGEAETTVLSQLDNEKKFSSRLWAKQTTKFGITKNSNMLVTAVKNNK